MTVSNASTLATHANLIDSEFISRLVNIAVDTPQLYQLIGREIDISAESSRTYTHPILANLAAAAAVTETDEVASASITNAQSQITTALVARSTFLSEQAEGASVIPVITAAVERVVRAVQTKLDIDIVGLSASMTNTQGDNTTNHTITNHNSVMTAFRAQAKNPGMVGMVLHPDAVRDLNAAAVVSGAPFWSTMQGQSVLAAGGGARQGFNGQTADGVMVMISDRIPAADTTGWGNFVFDMGADNPLALVLKRGIRVDLDDTKTRFGRWVIGSVDFGVGVLDQARCYEFITRT